MANKIIMINGKPYDAATGLPVKPAPRPRPVRVAAPRKVPVKAPRKIRVSSPPKPVKPPVMPKKPVRRPAPSRTLNRQAIKKPLPKVVVAAPRPRPVAQKPRSMARPAPMIATRPTPIAPRNLKRRVSPERPMPVLQAEPAPTEKTPEQKKKIRNISLLVSGIALILVAVAVLLYIFVPTVSFWMATVRSEVSGSLPTYAPAGYSVDGIVESSPGMVNVKYKSPSSDGYSLSQQNSNWDSESVLENKVKPVSNDYQTLTQKGLTIYRFKDQAIWVNGGILFTITDNNKLSNEQILKIVDGI
ncbi:MAG: DUF4367 domain-containing protein [Candidatus Nomurabacteria bacterium]|jgi:hypothetical protein|nr:DUF4367 domain-containing protein [Candidatus Nomurabacteria bacterium]